MEKKKVNNVKFDRDKQHKMKFLSKFIYVLAKIGRIVTVVGGVCILLAMAITPVLVNNLEIKDNNITMFNQKVTFEQGINETAIMVGGNKVGTITGDEMLYFNSATNELSKANVTKLFSFVELALLAAMTTVVLSYFALLHLEKLFNNIYNNETPFILENVTHIKKIAYFLIAIVITSFIYSLIAEVLFKNNLNINIDLTHLIYILIIFSLSYIFEYGYMLQKNSKATMYGEIVDESE